MSTCVRVKLFLKFAQNFSYGSRTGRFILSALIFFFFLTACCGPRGIKRTSPHQPLSGPGSADYRHTAVTKNSYGRGDDQYWIFEPASPTPKSAPLIVFNHGWIAMNPGNYGAWIDHLVRRGNIVVYPRYQSSRRTPPDKMTHNAINAVKNAITHLQSETHVTPQLDKFAIVGHSLGGGITANMAALATTVGLPEPKAITLAEPGEGGNIGAHILHPDLSTISPNVLLQVVIGSEDTIAGSDIGKRIIKQTPQIPPSNKEFITIFSDYHGDPPLVADHYAPVAPDNRYNMGRRKFLSLIRRSVHRILGAEVDALDYFGFWKLFDGVTDAAFYGKNREYALGNTPKQRFMGTWSDGTPVKELRIIKNP